MAKPHTPLTREVVNKLREKTELEISNPVDRSINYLAIEWLQKDDRIKILGLAIKDRDDQIAKLKGEQPTWIGPFKPDDKPQRKAKGKRGATPPAQGGQ